MPKAKTPATPLETHELRDVEILRTGEWNGITWNESDIDQAIANFNEGVVAAPIKITDNGYHGGQPITMPGGAALGWISALKRVGEKLFATLSKVPKVIAQLIEAGAFAKKSIEGWTNYETADGVEHGRVIDGLLFSGIGAPAVHGLADLVTLYTADPLAEGRFACCSDTGAARPDTQNAVLTNAGAGAAGSATNTTKGEKNVEDITIPRERFEALVGSEKELSYAKDAREEAEKRLRETEAKLAERDKKIESDGVKLQAYQAKEKEMDRSTIVADVEKLVADGRVEPARKDAEINLLADMSIEDRKGRIELLTKITPLFGENVAATKPEEKTDTTSSSDVRTKALAYQKEHPGVSYREATAAVTAGG